MFTITNKYKKLIKLLKLDKPLIIFDIETTGLVIYKDKICELAYIKILPDGRTKKEEMIFNPEIPITREATAIHGLKERDVNNKPTFRQKTQELWEIFNNCYYSGFNIVNFDLPILRREFIRVGMDFNYEMSQIIDTRVIYQHMVPRSLSATYRYYTGKEFKQDHTALGDVEITAEILVEQLEKYNEIQDLKFVNKIHQVSDSAYVDRTRKFYWRHGEAFFAFSKYRDMALAEVAKLHPRFLQWILKADFSDETKNVVKKALNEKKDKSDNK